MLAVAVLVLSATDAGGPPAGDARRTAAGGRPAGTLVFVSGRNRLTAIDVATGRRRVRRLRSLAGCGPDLYLAAGQVIFAGVRKRRTVVFTVPLSLDRPPTRLGPAHAFVPSGTPGRVWLAGVDCNRRRMVGVQERTVEGRVTFRSYRPVPDGWLVGATRRGLVLQRGRSAMVWNPRTGETGERLPLEGVSAVREERMVGCVERTSCRRLAILDAATGKAVVARPPDSYRLDPAGEFSPDGSLLASPAVADRRFGVALVDTRDGTTTMVPGSRVGRAYPQLSWAASSGWLFFRGSGGRIMAYRPGQRRARALPFHMPRRAVAFTAG